MSVRGGRTQARTTTWDISELMRAAIQQEPGNPELLQEVSLCEGWCCLLGPTVQCNIELYLISLVETDQ